MLGVLSGAACVFTFALAEGLSLVGDAGLGVGVVALVLSETADPVLRMAGVLGLDVAEVGVELPTRAAVD